MNVFFACDVIFFYFKGSDMYVLIIFYLTLDFDIQCKIYKFLCASIYSLNLYANIPLISCFVLNFREIKLFNNNSSLTLKESRAIFGNLPSDVDDKCPQTTVLLTG